MGKNWKQVKESIEREIEKVWIEEPDEIKKLRFGIVPTKAGTYGQYFTTLIWGSAEVRCLGYISLYNLIRASEGEAFTLEQCKKLARLFIPTTSNFLGYCALPTVGRLADDLLESLETLQTKDNYRELMMAFWTYVNRMQMWVHHIFPWGLALNFPQRTFEEIKEMSKLAKGKDKE